MATSEVAICANALRLLGQQPIVSLTDDNTAGRLCNALYADTRDLVLAAYPWNFAQERASLAKLATAPLWGYTNAFQLPTDPYCLRVLATEDQDTWPWKIEGRKLLTDAGTVNILYIAQVSDPSLFSTLFRGALERRLAAELAFPITGDLNASEKWLKAYAASLAEARSLDGQEGTPRQAEMTDLVDVR